MFDSGPHVTAPHMHLGVTPFGRAMHVHWGLDPDTSYLNHGTVGATPLRVLAAQQAIRDAIEWQPSRFLLRELAEIAVEPRDSASRMRIAAAAVARFIGAQRADLVFVDNVTSGINAVLRSLEFETGDEILVSDLGYGAITNAASYVARRSGATVRTVALPLPAAGADAIAQAYAAALGPHTKLAIVDHITSESALILPVQDIAARCHARGVPVLVDGAHAPGAIALDVPALGADWYAANLHKWAYSPRSCGFLWAAPERQAELHPPVISWGLDQGWTAEFDWTGTRDPSPYLAAPDGIALQREFGLEALRAYNHDLAWAAARMLSARFETELGTPESMIGTMATVALPQSLGTAREHAVALRNALLLEDRIEVQMHAARGRLWARVSAQIYNEMAEYERLAEAILARV